MALSRVENKEFRLEFIQMYRDLPELCKTKNKSELHKNRNLKSLGYDKLVKKMKEIKENIDSDTIKKNQRSSYCVSQIVYKKLEICLKIYLVSICTKRGIVYVQALTGTYNTVLYIKFAQIV